MVRLPRPLLGIYGKARGNLGAGSKSSCYRERELNKTLTEPRLSKPIFPTREFTRFLVARRSKPHLSKTQQTADALIKQTPIGAIGQIKSFNSTTRLQLRSTADHSESRRRWPCNLERRTCGRLHERTAKPKPRLICLTPNLLAVCIDMVDFGPDGCVYPLERVQKWDRRKA